MRRRTAETVALAGAVLALLLARNLWVLRTPVLAEGDYGSNSLRVDLAKHFEQLVGHYSRFGFDHPGPAYFYVQAAFEWLLHDVVALTDAPYNAQLLGILVLNSVLLATCAAIIALRTRRRLNALLFLAIAVLVVSAETGGFGAPGFLLAGNWTPHASVVPFLTFLVAGASVLSGRFESLWIVALTGALLVHGYISFVAFVVPISLALGAWIWWTSRGDRQIWRRRRRTLVITVLILAAFLLPIALETLLNWPGQIPEYWRYAFGDDRGRHALDDSARYFVSFWWRGRPAIGLLLVIATVATAVALTWRQHDQRIRGFSVALLAMSAMASVCFAYYAVAGVDDLVFRFVSFFYLSVPAITYSVIAINVAEYARASSARRVLRPIALAGALALIIAAVVTPGLSNPYRGDSTLDDVVDALERDPRRQGRTVALDFEVHQWANVMGILDLGLRRGVPMCIANMQFADTVPERDVCHSDREWPVRIVSVDAVVPGDRIATAKSAAAVVPAETRTGGRSRTPPGHVHH